MAPFIIDEFALLGKVDDYREPFIGGGSVFYCAAQRVNPRKPNSFWINDIRPDLISMMVTIRDRPDLIENRLKEMRRPGGFLTLPYKEAYLIFWKESHNDRQIPRLTDRDLSPNLPDFSEDDKKEVYEEGTRTYWEMKLNFSGITGGGLSNCKFPELKTAKWKGIKMHSRLMNSINLRITCGDFSKLLEDDNMKSDIYLDPPYFDTGDGRDLATLYVKGKKDEFDHEALLKALIGLSPERKRFILSYNKHRLVYRLYRRPGFKIYQKLYSYSCNTSKKRSHPAKKMEVFITNQKLSKIMAHPTQDSNLLRFTINGSKLLTPKAAKSFFMNVAGVRVEEIDIFQKMKSFSKKNVYMMIKDEVKSARFYIFCIDEKIETVKNLIPRFISYQYRNKEMIKMENGFTLIEKPFPLPFRPRKGGNYHFFIAKWR